MAQANDSSLIGTKVLKPKLLQADYARGWQSFAPSVTGDQDYNEAVGLNWRPGPAGANKNAANERPGRLA